MNKFDLAAKTTLAALGCLIFLAIAVETKDPIEGTSFFYVASGLSVIFALLFILPGMYLWVTGFKRFREHLGHWGPKMLSYMVLTIIYAVYIQLRHGHELQNS